MEQLIFVAIFLLAGLVDLLIRWLRKKEAGSDPASPDELVILDDEEVVSEEQWRERQEWLERQTAEPPPEPVAVEPPRSAPSRAAPPRAEPPPVRAPALEEIAARRTVVSPVPPRAARPAPLPSRRARPRRWIAGPVTARQGIVVMTILGRCRGLE